MVDYLGVVDGGGDGDSEEVADLADFILSPGDLEALEDTLELLSDPQALTEIQIARDDLAHGRVVTAEELRSRYLHR